MTNGTRDPHLRLKVLQAIRALVSDDHNYERGLANLRDIVDDVARQDATAGLGDLTLALSLELADALERIARDEGLSAHDLVEVWFAD